TLLPYTTLFRSAVDLVAHAVVIRVQVERRQRMRGDAGASERVVVAAHEEALFGARIRHDRYSRLRQHLPHRRSLVSGEPGPARSARQGIGPSDHLDLELRRRLLERDHGVREVGPRADSATFLACERD